MSDILVEHAGPIATVVFNRPQLRNAISLAMWTEIARATEGLAKDDSVLAIVYRGAGRDAFAMGLIQRLLPTDELEPYTVEYLRQVGENAPLSVRGSKHTIHYYLQGMTDERRSRLRELTLEAFESEDYKEGTRAFLEKRAPKFQGR